MELPKQSQAILTSDSIILQVSAVAHGPREAGLCTLKSYQLLLETQLPQMECAMLHVTMNGQTRRPRNMEWEVAEWVSQK